MGLGQTYANPRFGTPQIVSIAVEGADAAANDELGRIRFFNKVKVLEARAVIGRTVGKGTTSAITVLKGTNSIGAIAISTNTEGTVVDASLTDTVFASTDDLVLQNVVATDTFAANIFIRYQDEFE